MSKDDCYLCWLARETPTQWWHDSAVPDELRQGLAHGASGVTTNPVLICQAVSSNPALWKSHMGELRQDLNPGQRAEALMETVIRHTAQMLEPEYERSGGRSGYVCAQVNPAAAADREAMIAMARNFHAWAPNIAVKLPVTSAGLDALEECASEGITITATVSFTVPQVIAVAERYRQGLLRAKSRGKKPGYCFSVIMIGRLDDYLRDVVRDRQADVGESDIRQAGLAVTKRAYSIYKERQYEAMLMVAALRGAYHMEELAGGDLIMSMHPKYQTVLSQSNLRKQSGIDRTIPDSVINRLETVPEFIRAYEPGGMAPEDFITFGATQRTLTQFSEAGWLRLTSFCFPQA